MASNIVRLCTAAIAGSLIGIAYERLPPNSFDFPNLMKTVSAASNIVPRGGKTINNIELPNESFLKKSDIDPIVAGDNLKHSSKFGLPSSDNIRIFNDFVLSYDRRLRSPAWVIEHLTPEKLKDKRLTDRSRSKFHEDPGVHEYFRAKNVDFTHSGYDRGHMAAAGNHKNSQQDLDQTFVFSNISPQVPEFNRGAWERLESYVRWRANRAKNLYVVTGPLFLPQKARDGNLYVTYRVLGNNHISVPTHYFKVFLIETNDDKLVLEAFLMPNDPKLDENTKLDDYRVPIDRLDVIERASGAILFDQIPRNQLEAPTALAPGFKEGPRKTDHKNNRQQQMKKLN